MKARFVGVSKILVKYEWKARLNFAVNTTSTMLWQSVNSFGIMVKILNLLQLSNLTVIKLYLHNVVQGILLQLEKQGYM